MKDALLLGLGRVMLPLPAVLWRNQVAQNARHTEAGLGFMSADHPFRHLKIAWLRLGESLCWRI